MSSSQTTDTGSAPVRPTFRRRGHIVLALVAVLVLVGVGPLATVSWKLIDINQEALSTAHQEYQLLLASSIAREMNTHVDGLAAELLRVSQTLGGAMNSRGTANHEEVRRILSDVTDERMLHLRYAYFRGGEVRSVSAGDLPEYLEPLFGATLGQVAKLQSGGVDRELRPLLSDPLLLETTPPRAVIVAAAPVVSRGTFRGVLTALIDLQSVWDGVVTPIRTGHEIFGLTPAGTVFASKDPRVRAGRDVESPLVQRFLSLSEEGHASETMPFEIARDGARQRYMGAYHQMLEGWGIFVQAPESQAFVMVHGMRKETLTWALAALGLAGLVGMIFARSLSKPINRLAAASRAFAKGDFSARVQVRSGNEIGELAYTFNIMAMEIESYIRKLRQALRENRELFLGTIRAIANAIDAKDPYTRGHSHRVNRYSVILAQQLKLPDHEIGDIHVASLLHDVGKIGIDDAILRKPGALTDEEFEIMKTHTTRGAEIMQPIAQMKPLLPGLRSHHERCNGRGYPDSLTRDETPLMARIIAVADTFDAITTRRPYQEPMTFEQAVARVNELKGDSLDEKVVEAFNRACNSGLIRLGREGTADTAARPARVESEQPEPELAGAVSGQPER